MGAGSRDVRDRPNVVRVVLGERQDRPSDAGVESILSVLETNVDDLDPRVWPTVLATLLDAGAADAWLVPIVMKKGRPAHTLAVLTSPDARDALRRLMFELTSTSGVREVTVHRTALRRGSVPVSVMDGQVRIKVAYLDGEIIHATPEFEDAAAIAVARARPGSTGTRAGHRRCGAGRSRGRHTRRRSTSVAPRSARRRGPRRTHCRCSQRQRRGHRS